MYNHPQAARIWMCFFFNKEDYGYIEIAIVGILHPQDKKIHGYRLTDISFISKDDYFRYDTNGIYVYMKNLDSYFS